MLGLKRDLMKTLFGKINLETGTSWMEGERLESGRAARKFVQ